MIRVGGGEDDAGCVRLLPQPLRDFQAREPGHADVQEDQVVVQGVQQQQGLFPVGGLAHDLNTLSGIVTLGGLFQ